MLVTTSPKVEAQESNSPSPIFCNLLFCIYRCITYNSVILLLIGVPVAKVMPFPPVISSRKTLQTRLEKLNQKEKKDQVVTFEELGVDHLYVDEAHSYKNAFLYTKMRNVAGIAQNEAQKSADMFIPCTLDCHFQIINLLP